MNPNKLKELAKEELLCPGCLEVVWHDQLLCHKCGCPQDFVSATLPVTRIFAEGYILRKAVTKPKLISLLMIWFIFGHLAASGLLQTVLTILDRQWLTKSEIVFCIIMGLSLFLLGLSAVFQVTINYLRNRLSNNDLNK